MTKLKSTISIPKKPAERRAWIIYQLRLKGLSFAELSRREGVSRQAVQFATLIPSARIEPVLAAALGLTPQQLFPERFDDAGNRLHKSRHNTTPRRTGNVQKERAA